MRQWFSKLLGGQESDAATSAPAPAAALAPQQAGAEIDAAWYRWLGAAAGQSVPDEVQQGILDEVDALAGAGAEAAGLVPRVPEVIPRLLRSLRDEAVSLGELARQVNQDVVLVAEVIREANSAYHRPMMPVETVENAIMMLGQNGLRMLLARIAFRPLVKLQAGGFTRRVAPQVWAHSEKCALAASLMAPGLSAGVFEAYLAGLMQGVGLVVAFRVVDRHCEGGAVPASSEFGLALLARSRRLSAAIACHWDFPPDVVQAIDQAGAPGQSSLAQALARGDRIAKLRVLIDAGVLGEDDPLVGAGLDGFERRCLGKLIIPES